MHMIALSIVSGIHSLQGYFNGIGAVNGCPSANVEDISKSGHYLNITEQTKVKNKCLNLWITAYFGDDLSKVHISLDILISMGCHLKKVSLTFGLLCQRSKANISLTVFPVLVLNLVQLVWQKRLKPFDQLCRPITDWIFMLCYPKSCYSDLVLCHIIRNTGWGVGYSANFLLVIFFCFQNTVFQLTHLGLPLFYLSPTEATREIKGFVMHICAVRESGAVFHEAYMWHQAKMS